MCVAKARALKYYAYMWLYLVTEYYSIFPYEKKYNIIIIIWGEIPLGLTHLRSYELMRKTFPRFGHPRVINLILILMGLLATSTKICA